MKTGNFRLTAKAVRARLILLVLSCFMVQAYAEDMNTRLAARDVFHQEWERASDEELAMLRGGFILPNGLHIEMSLEKFVHLNDVLVHASSVQYPGDGVVLQVGVQNFVSGSSAAPVLGTFVQNALDSQHIEALTKINVEISNMKGVMANGGGNNGIFTNLLAPALLR